MTAHSGTDLTLVSPSGKEYRPEAAPANSDPDNIFSEAVRRVFQIKKPEAGEWSLKLIGKGDAYFALTRIESLNKTRVKASKKVFRKGEVSELDVSLGVHFKGSVKHPRLTKSVPGRTAAANIMLPEIDVNDEVKMSFAAPTEPGVYNMSFDIDGVNDKGEKMVRSVNYNFAVTDEQGNIDR